jgi:hypothetical protein
VPLQEIHLPDWQHLSEASMALQGVLKQMGASFGQIGLLRNGMRRLEQLQPDDAAAVADFRERYQYLQFCVEKHQDKQAAAEFTVTWDDMFTRLTAGQESD